MNRRQLLKSLVGAALVAPLVVAAEWAKPVEAAPARLDAYNAAIGATDGFSMSNWESHTETDSSPSPYLVGEYWDGSEWQPLDERIDDPVPIVPARTWTVSSDFLTRTDGGRAVRQIEWHGNTWGGRR